MLRFVLFIVLRNVVMVVSFTSKHGISVVAVVLKFILLKSWKTSIKFDW